jgi:hypothetical protein
MLNASNLPKPRIVVMFGKAGVVDKNAEGSHWTNGRNGSAIVYNLSLYRLLVFEVHETIKWCSILPSKVICLYGT